MLYPFQIIKLLSVDSTNKYARQLVQSKLASNRTVVLAEFQTDGRGMGTNHWESEPGQNLLMSLIFAPQKLKITNQHGISIAVSLAIKDFLAKYIQHVAIKWPNDILVKSRKIAGILIENIWVGERVEQSIVGIGLNLNQQNFGHHRFAPTSYFLECHQSINIDWALKQLLDCISVRLDQLEQEMFDKLTKEYLSHLYLFNKQSCFLINGKLQIATITGIGEFGSIQLTLDTGKTVHHQHEDIEYVLPS